MSVYMYDCLKPVKYVLTVCTYARMYVLRLRYV